MVIITEVYRTSLNFPVHKAPPHTSLCQRCRYGRDEVRLTVEENILIPHIKDADVDAVCKDIAEKIPRWSVAPKTLQKGTVSCAGNQFCSLSNINTKGNAVEIADRYVLTFVSHLTSFGVKTFTCFCFCLCRCVAREWLMRA